MATAESTQPALMTIEEFVKLPDPGVPQELVRGRVVRMSPPKPYHGWVCMRVGWILANHVEENDLGYVMCNDSGVITRRNPDSLRGADVAFYSYARVPKGSLPTASYLDVVPDLIIEVLSPDDRWPKVLEKVAEYLNACVGVVGVLDPEARTMHLFEGERPVRVLGPEEEFALPDVLGAFRQRVAGFFE